MYNPSGVSYYFKSNFCILPEVKISLNTLVLDDLAH